MKKKIMVIIAALFVITAAVATVGAAGRGKVGNPSAAVSGICDGVPTQDGTGMQYGKNENAGQGNGAGGCIYDGECPNDGVPAQDGTGMVQPAWAPDMKQGKKPRNTECPSENTRPIRSF